MCREYIDLIKLSLRQVEAPYYKLTTTYEPSGIVRERVFCYELYHKIRSNMRSHHRLSLNGEIQKQGHIDFEKKDRKNPDFVFHVPGTHEHNTLIVEVKGKIVDEIKKDFTTLLTFVNKYDYMAGIFILYNHSFEELISNMGSSMKPLRVKPKADAVYVLSIKQAGDTCEERLLSRV
jgi:hypothetical protein